MMLKKMLNLKSLTVFSILLITFLSAKTIQAKNSGKDVFEYCTQCHGSSGEGNPKVQVPAIAGLPSWYVKEQIMKFRKGLRGSHPGDMPGLRMRPMAKVLRTEEDIQLVSDFVSQLTPVKHPDTIKGSFVKGEEAFKGTCVACHGADGKGNETLKAPPLIYSQDWYLVTQLKNYKDGRRGAVSGDMSGATMRPNALALDEDKMNDLVSYIRTLQP